MESTMRKIHLTKKFTCVLLPLMVVLLMFGCFKQESLNPVGDRKTKMKYLPRRASGSSSTGTSSSPPLHFDLNPVNGNHVKIIHNAVPKTGSRTLELFLRELPFSRTSRTSLLHCYVFPQNISTNVVEIEQFVGSMTQGSYTRGHFPYTDISKKYLNTRYINIVRPPIERLVSNYYFDLFGDEQKQRENSSRVRTHEATLDECLEKEICYDKVYTYYKQRTLLTFCGQDPRCKNYNRWTLERAKENARKYLFIGLTNQFTESISLLEMLLPDLFNGLTDLYVAKNEKANAAFKTIKKMELKNKTLEFLQRDMDLEFEFYHFVYNGFVRAMTESMEARK